MPDPLSGVPGSIVPPAAPENTKDAINAKPGLIAQPPGAGGSSSDPDASTAKPHKAPPAKKNKDKDKTHWIEIVLLDEAKDPVPGETYRVTLPDGSVAQGTLDEKGFARVEGIEPGQCKVTFPSLDKDAWQEK